jgi:hypothetical protein
MARQAATALPENHNNDRRFHMGTEDIAVAILASQNSLGARGFKRRKAASISE